MAAHDTAWIGTWDLPKTRGADALTVCERDRATGALTPIRSLLPGVSVGAMHLDERRRVLYVTDEDTRHGADRQGAGGSVIALAVHDDGALVEIGRRPSYGSLPSYVAVDPTGGFLLVTNHTASAPVARLAGSRAGDYRMTLAYDTATTVLFPLGGDGGIGEPLDILVHDAPAGPRPGQTHPRPHCVVASPSGAFFVVCDKGSDRILTIDVDADAGRSARSPATGSRRPRAARPATRRSIRPGRSCSSITRPRRSSPRSGTPTPASSSRSARPTCSSPTATGPARGSPTSACIRAARSSSPWSAATTACACSPSTRRPAASGRSTR